MSIHILIISYYELRESLLSAAHALRDLGCNVTSYPLMEHKNDLGIGTTLIEHFKRFVDTMQAKQNATYHAALWWYIGVSYDVMLQLKQQMDTNTLQLLFNWDDPYMWTQPECQMQLKASLFDISFATCEATLTRYAAAGCKRATYLLPGFDMGIHYPLLPSEQKIQLPQYDCDISICCTNWYKDKQTYPDQSIPTRYEITTKIAQYLRTTNNTRNTKQKKFTFAIYGPEYLQTEFQEFYRGPVSYMNTRNIFARSKINICTHVVGKMRGYLSERVSLILGSGGLLWMDDVPQTLIRRGVHFIPIDRAVDPIEQIQSILDMPTDTLQKIKSAGFELAASKLTWSHWADAVVTAMFANSTMMTINTRNDTNVISKDITASNNNIAENYLITNFNGHTNVDSQLWHEHWVTCFAKMPSTARYQRLWYPQQNMTTLSENAIYKTTNSSLVFSNYAKNEKTNLSQKDPFVQYTILDLQKRRSKTPTIVSLFGTNSNTNGTRNNTAALDIFENFI